MSFVRRFTAAATAYSLLLQLLVGTGYASSLTAQSPPRPDRVAAASSPAYSVVLHAVSTSFNAITGIAAYEPTNELAVASGAAGHDFELIAADGAHRSFSSATDLARGARIVTARGGGTFEAGTLFAPSGNQIVRVSADGVMVQTAWATLAGETEITALTVDRTGAFGGDVIAVTAAGNVWRINASAVATRVAAIGVALASVTTLADDPDRHGPWSGCIVAGASAQPALYAVNAAGVVTTHQTSAVPRDLAVVMAHENFFGIDAGDGKLWGAPAGAFAEMVGDVVLAQAAPGVLLRIHWNGTAFESAEIARVAHWQQIVFSPAGVTPVLTARRPYDRIAVVRHAPVLSSGRVDGALWQLSAESVTLDGNDTITSDLLVPGMPQVTVSGSPHFGGTVEGNGEPTPSTYAVSVSGNATLGHLITRTDPITLEPVAAFTPTTNTRDVSLTKEGESAGDFATLRDLSISGKAGPITVPPGRYGRLTASGRTTFVLGIAGATQPAQYELDSLTLSGGSELRVAGPVVLTLNNGAKLTGSTMGSGEVPRQLVVRMAGGGLEIDGKSVLYAIVRAPQSTVTINGGGRLRGTLSCDRLDLSGTVQLTESDLPPPPVNRPPAVDAGANASVTLPDGLTLRGAASDDGSTLTTQWTRVSGPGAVSFSDTHVLEPVATFTTAGTYVLRLTASDGLLASSDEVTITVKPANQAPMVNAGADLSIELPATASLGGTITDDGLPQGSITAAWSKVSGPADVTFGDETAPVTTAMFAAAGTYVLRLSADDGELSSSDDVTVTVAAENHAPAVDAGADQFIVHPAAATLAGTVSDDGLPAGSVLSSTWTRASGPGQVTFADATSAATTATFSATGVYVLRLTATDGRVAVSDDVTVTVDPENTAPVVNAGADQIIALPATATLAGTVADDDYPRGSQLAITWSGPAGVTFANANVASTTATFAAAGTYTLRLTATDGALTTFDEVVITVDPENIAPVVSAGADQTIALPATATLAGTVTDDDYPRGSQLAITWSGPAGVTFANANVASTTATFAAEGTYTLRLTATDGALTTFDEVVITVDPENTAPVVNAGVDQIIALPATATLAGTVTDDDYPRGSQLTITWSGPSGVTFANANAASTTATFAAAGTYTLRLTATDGALTTFDEVVITVDPENTAPVVNAGVDQIIALPATATLAGTVTDDDYPRGSQLTITWSGPAGVTFANANVASTTATFAAAGTYTLRLTATDGASTTFDEVVITVDPENMAPVVDAGSNLVVELPATATLNGTVTDDGYPRGSQLTIAWSGPAGVTFANANEASTTATFAAAGTYTLTLTATDGVLTSTDEVVIDVRDPNTAPVVDAGADQTIRLPQTAALHATVTDDGTQFTVAWSGPAGVTFSSPNAASTTATFAAPGTYVLRITVDDSKLQSSDELTVTVLPANTTPVVSAGANQTITLPATAALQGIATDDGVPSPLTYAWTGPAGVTFSNASALATTASFAAAGTYVLRLTASDGELSASAEVTITVQPANTKPVVDAGADRTVNVGETATLNGKVTDESSSLSIQWTVISGPSAPSFGDPNAASTTVFFSTAGIYVLRLTASDGELTASDDVTIAAVRPPVADFTVPAISRNVAKWDNNLASRAEGAVLVAETSNDNSNFGVNAIDDSPYSQWRSGTGQTTNQALTIRLAGDGPRTFDRIRITNSTAAAEAVKNFRLQISSTTADDAAFTTILTSIALNNSRIQEFPLDAAAKARYVRFVFLDNYGALNMGLRDLEVVGTGLAGLDRLGALNVADYQQSANVVASTGWVFNPILALDGDPTRYWVGNTPTNSGFTIQLIQESRIDRFRILSEATDGARPRDITIEVAADLSGPYTNVLAATVANQGGWQEFAFPGGAVKARYVRFTCVNNYGSKNYNTINDIEVLSADRPSVSGMSNPYERPELMFDDNVDSLWTLPGNRTSNQYVVVHLTDDEPRLIDAVEMHAYYRGPAESVKDFDVLVSNTTDDDASFQLVLSGTVDTRSSLLQRFAFPGGPVRARWVKFVAKTNGGHVSSMHVPTFHVLTVDNGGNLLPVPTTAPRVTNLSPAQAVNGAAVVASTGSGVAAMLDYINSNGWITAGLTNQYATIELGGGTRSVSGVRIAPHTGSNSIQNFEVWVSSTTADDAAFAKVLSGTVTTELKMQSFLFPGGAVPVRYIKLVPLTRHGTGNFIHTNAFDVILPVHPGGAVAASSTLGYYFPEGTTSTVNGSNPWQSVGGSNEWITVALPGSVTRAVYGVNIETWTTAGGPRDMDILVSNTTSDESAFTLAWSGTAIAGQKAYRFGRVFDAKYVRFYFKTPWSTSSVFQISKLDVLTLPDDGGAVLGASSGLGSNVNPNLVIDVDPISGAWSSDSNKNTNQTFTVGLPGSKLWRIDHVALQASGTTAPRDFEIQVSAGDTSDASYVTVYRGTLRNAVEHCFFPGVSARAVRLVMLNNWGAGNIALQNFWIFSPQVGGRVARFLDSSIPGARNIVSWSWTFGDGGTSTDRDPVHTYAGPGTYEVSLTVTDADGLTMRRSMQYTVWGDPVVNFTVTPASPLEHTNAAFVDTSTSPAGAIATSDWSWGDGTTPASNTKATNHLFADNGSYVVTHTITDARGVPGSLSKTVTVLNAPPNASAGPDLAVPWGEPWGVKPAVSDVAADLGTIVCHWDFGDGTTADVTNCHSNAAVVHRYADIGTFTATLTATDKDGGVATDTVVTTTGKRPTLINYGGARGVAADGSVALRGLLRDGLSHDPIAGGTLIFDVEGQTVSAVTDAGGSAAASLNYSGTSTQPVVNIRFDATDLYTASTTAATLSCPPSQQPLDVALVIDLSGSMTDAVADAKVAFIRLIDSLMPGRDQATVVAFADSAQVRQALTGDLDLARKAVDTFAIFGGTQIEAGIDAGRTQLTGPNRNPAAQPVLILFSDGGDNATEVIAAANAAKAAGIRIISIGWKSGTGAGYRYDVMNPLASSPSDYYEITTAPQLQPLFHSLPGTLCVAANAAPVVSVLPTHYSIILPTSTVTLKGTVADDGKPAGSTLVTTWSKVSGPGDVTFSAPNALQTTVTFTAAGTYVIRFSAFDGEYTIHADANVVVIPQNTAPVVNAGPDLAATLEPELLKNGSAEEPLVNGKLPSWGEVTGSWTATTAGPEAFRGTKTIVSSGVNTAEMIQDIDVSLFGARIDGGVQSFAWSAFVNVADEATPDAAKIIIEYRSVNGGSVLKTVTTADISPVELWERVSGVDVAPSGTRVIRMHLVAARRSGTTADVWFDAVSLRPVAAGAVRAVGTATDDGIPNGLQINWSQVSGPGQSSIFGAFSRTATMAATTAGVYVYRLTASDGALSTSDEVTATYAAANAIPAVNAGADATVELPNTGTLAATAADESASTLVWTWFQLSGPIAAIAEPHAASTTVTFPVPGTYLFRVYADDGDRAGSDEITVTVKAGPGNQPPVVNAGPDFTLTDPPRAMTLNGSVTDDGLPNGASLTYAWNKVSGPGNVGFAAASQPVTAVSFSTTGTYVLRLSSSDTNLIGSDDVVINVVTNKAPVVNAGADVVFSDGQPVPVLDGTAIDNEIPPGSALTVQWTRISGPGTVTFSSPAQLTTAITLGARGRYVLRLTATDSQLSASDDVVIIWDGPNAAPSVNAGEDQTITLSNPASLAAIVTDDGLPATGTLSMGWSRVSGPADVTFASPGSATTTATFTATGEYVLRITATDGEATASDDVTIAVKDAVPPPEAEITSPASGSVITDRTTFVGTVSSGATWRLEYRLNGNDDGAAGMPWQTVASGAGPLTNTPLGTFDPTLLLNGIYKVRLVATDAVNQSTSSVVSAVVDSNLKVGLFSLTFNDLEIPLPGMSIRVDRTYDSRDTAIGDFGHGWRLNLNNMRVYKSRVLGTAWQQTSSSGPFPQYCISATAPHLVSLVMPNGKSYRFRAEPFPACQSLVPIETPTMTFVPVGSTRGSLEAEGENVVIVDGSIPGPISLVTSDVQPYNPTTFRFTDEEGIVYRVSEINGVLQITDRNQNVITIGRNGIAHSAGRSVMFVRDSAGRITSIIDAAGNALTYTYDANGDLEKFTDQTERATTYTYDSAHHLIDYFDSMGRRGIRNEYDATGRLVASIDAAGNPMKFDYDPLTRREAVTDRRGQLITYEYDEDGNVTRIIDADGLSRSATFDDDGNVLTATDKLGHTTTYEYDARGNRTKMTDAENRVTRYEFNAFNQLLSITNANQQTTSMEYDANGRVSKTTLPDGTTLRYGYDARGNLATITDDQNNVRTMEYDDFGNMIKDTDARGFSVRATYDPMGRMLTSTDRAGKTTTYGYDEAGRLTSTTDPLGKVSRQEYDGNGEVSAAIDSRGNRTEVASNAKALPTSLTRADGTTLSLEYEPGDVLTKVTRSDGHTTSSELTKTGLEKKVFVAPGIAFTYELDDEGRRTAEVDPRGNRTAYELDDTGRLDAVIDAYDHRTEYRYDGVGNITSVIDANLNAVAFKYDALQRLVRQTFPDQSYMENSYDSIGRLQSIRDQNGHVRKYTYDAQENVKTVTEPNDVVTSAEYDGNGNPTSITDGRGHTVTATYDDLGRTETRTYPDDSTEQWTYEIGMAPKTMTDRAGRTTSFQYDSRNHPSRITYDDGASITMTYTPDEKLDVITGPNDSVDHEYDLRGNLLRATYADGTVVQYTYNEMNNRISMTTPVGKTTYEYDAMNRLAKVIDHHGHVTKYGYDSVGNLTTVEYPNGLVTTRTFTVMNEIESTKTTKPDGTVVFGETYTYDDAGNRTEILSPDGSSALLTYDSLSRLDIETYLAADGTITRQLDYDYDEVGNRKSVTNLMTGVQLDSAFDAMDQLQSDGVRTYTYDGSGNTKTVTNGSAVRQYTYDARDLLTRIEGSDGSVVSHHYDARGYRIRTTSNGTVTEFLNDPGREVGRVLLERDGARQLVAGFTYGEHLISAERGGAETFYIYDALGSVRALADANGSITDRYDYDAFGATTMHIGTTTNAFLYRGQRLDVQTGLYHLHSRDYDPSTGRFIERDTYSGAIEDPQSRNRYVYAVNNPVNRIDPTGRRSGADGTAAHGVIAMWYARSCACWPWTELRLKRIPEAGIRSKKSGGLGLRPDLVDFLTGDVYEVKPLSPYGLATVTGEALGYVLAMNYLVRNDYLAEPVDGRFRLGVETFRDPDPYSVGGMWVKGHSWFGPGAVIYTDGVQRLREIDPKTWMAAAAAMTAAIAIDVARAAGRGLGRVPVPAVANAGAQMLARAHSLLLGVTRLIMIEASLIADFLTGMLGLKAAQRVPV